MVTWFTGNSGAGKTTLAKRLQEERGGILLDGDEMRTVWTDLGLSAADRVEQNLRVARLAKVLDKQGINVTVATICPYRELRAKVQRICGCQFRYVQGGQPPSDEYPYESS